MVRQEEEIGVEIDIMIVLAVVGKYPVEEIDDTEGGEIGTMKVTAQTEEITIMKRDRIITIGKKGMIVLEL